MTDRLLKCALIALFLSFSALNFAFNPFEVPQAVAQEGCTAPQPVCDDIKATSTPVCCGSTWVCMCPEDSCP
ncbi:MAG: hypothetical protein JWP89_1127 [Schlesneria sp.]|nr:hypothetical protein [Schlesneria sp.]